MTLYRQAEQLLVNEAAALPLTFGKNYFLVQPYVKNLRISDLGIIAFNEVSITPH